jgi:AcrR family transcriptional regulator
MAIEKLRARNDREKQQRREKLLEAARDLFAQLPYEAVTMAGIAEKTGLAKGTVFFYFKTKEELFLALQEQLLQEWFEEINSLLNSLQGKGTPGQVAAMLCQSLEGRAALTRLLAILHTTLEQNVDFDAALRFKQFLLQQLLTTGRALEKSLPFLAAGQGAQVLLRIDALIIGLEHLSNPGPVGRQVLDHMPGKEALEVDFKSELQKTVEALLYGLEKIAQNE